MKPEEVIVDETVLDQDGIEPFDWEDHPYESWLEKAREKEKGKPAQAGI